MPTPSRPSARTARGATAARWAAPVLLAAAALPATAAAQGSLSVQGFGYPTGQLGTRTLGTGGGLAEFDPISPLNPAALAAWGRPTLSLQYDPEFRRTTAAGASRTTVARFPVFSAAFPVRGRYVVGVSASTLLDRSFSTVRQTTLTFDETPTPITVGVEDRADSRGSIADLRLGVGAVVTRWLRVGLAGHALTGENRLSSERRFAAADTLRFGNVGDTTTVDYHGSAVSAGVEVTPVRGLSLAGSYRLGGGLRTTRNDSVLTRADAPDRLGVGVRVDRVTGATFAASWARTRWSNMRGLGSSAVEVHDATELMGGVEAVGPRFGESALILRLGARQRTLPFGIAGAEVRETSLGGGAGLPLAGGRALFDLALQHANRTPRGGSAAVAGTGERAWTLSVGFTVRP